MDDKINKCKLDAVTMQVEEAIKRHITGYRFLGAMPEAEKAGYQFGSIEYKLFINLFIIEIKKVELLLDIEGKLI